MRFLLNDRSRAGMLFLCIGLIGGAGCADMINVAEQGAASRKAYEEKRRKIFDGYQAAAAQGDSLAQTRVALEYLAGPPDVARDTSKGVALLEQAAARRYGPAEYALGELLTTGRNAMRWVAGTTYEKVAPQSQPQRGAELLKQSATKACNYDAIADEIPMRNSPADTLSQLYRNGRILQKDTEQADLWLARGIFHCGYKNAYGVQYAVMRSKDPSPEERITALAWLMLMGSDMPKTKPLQNMSPEETQAAEAKAEALRHLVAESEHQYPAPPKPTKP